MRMFSLFFLVVPFFVFSQKKFSPGYYIDQNNVKNEGFIEDRVPSNNPVRIFFKTSFDSPSGEVLIANIKEFKISSDYKYVRYDVEYDYDQTAERDALTIFGAEPNLKSKSVLLKVLVEGKISLYKATIDDEVFYYIKGENDVKPELLVYRKYNLENKIRENNAYRKTLFEKMESDIISMNDVFKLKYDEKSLVPVFIKYNKNNNSLVEQNIDINREKNKFYYKVLIGTSSFTSTYGFNNRFDLKSDNNFVNPMIGFELSNVLGTNSKRAEIFGRLFYQQASIFSEFTTTPPFFFPDIDMSSNFSSLNLSAGYRHAFFKTERNKFFVDGSMGLSSIINGEVNIKTFNRDQILIGEGIIEDFSLQLFFTVGCGYTMNNRYSINLEYSFPKNYLNQYGPLQNGGFSSLNLIFTYTLNK
ncbi:hypothetical protein WFZ85_05505 [Flavobacterium sp. j3]|uniref:Outer membrane protein beta-barrel domain-containing protein n=1 Tax=Flavobacterium aureirubrum TaxID=3133147 RepID=A0ABU9N4H6_9FLAO